MNQLQLQIVPRLAYSASNFVVHAGTRGLIDDLRSTLEREQFSLTVLHGGEKRGKTHLSIRLADEMAQRAIFPHLVDGSEFSAWITQRISDSREPRGEVVIVDDADRYFTTAAAADSGPFVNIVELFRRHGGAFVFIVSKDLDQLGCDPHVMSRLRAGAQLSLGLPDGADMQELIYTMAVQRGISLTERKVEFLARRLGRDIAAIDEYLHRASQLAAASGKPLRLPVLSEAISSK